MPLPLRAHSATHPGLHHPRNEDAYSVLPTSEGGLLLVVCDGMGGMGRGDEASRLAIDALCSVMSRGEGLPPDRMRNALRVADQRIREELCEDMEQPGSTAVMVYVLDGAAHVAWVGDSRAYLIRGGRVVYRTRDHKLVEELVEAGQLTPEQAKESALAHVVTRALGGRSITEPAVHPATLGYPWKLHHGDRILLCSDGVCDLLEDDEISTLIEQATPAEGTSRLVETALLRGGHDNITCIVAVWDGLSWGDDEAATPVIHSGREVTPNASGGEFAGAHPDAFVEGRTDPDLAWDGRVTEEIDLRKLARQASLDPDSLERVSSEGGTLEEIPFSDLPTAEVPKAEADAMRAAVFVRPPPEPFASTWLAVGAALVALAVAAGIAAFVL